ncbi:hypothetical protein [Cupriavidus pauculus]|uniref:DODA-type extradiol aromatic ring-opening family dioxygenase n=1 Tax=Cupriavidus pauculus TaxID=82633 RepID=UPI0030F8FAB6
MGRIVSAAATSHTFGTTSEAEASAEAILKGMATIGRAIEASKPNVLLVVSSDHLNNFNLDAQIPLAVGIADEYMPLGDMGVPRDQVRGNREFAQAFANHCADVGFDLVPVEGINPDHGVGFPNAFCNSTGGATLVPLFVNTVMRPAPSCQRAYQLGHAFRNFVETQRPDYERVAVVGSGGLSHWICLPDSGRVNEEWDRFVLESLASGNGSALAKLTCDDILRDGGNGGLEIATWAFVAGACGEARGEVIYYEPMRSWWTGMGGVLMHLDN